MTRYIDADALKKAMDGYWGRCQRIRKPRNGETAVFLDIKAIVEDCPTIDAVPVRHGKWIPRYIKIAGRDFKHGMQCSVCAEPALDVEGDDYLTDYCPNCGCRMDEE